jgi:phytoene dehydrogenase-like protein
MQGKERTSVVVVGGGLAGLAAAVAAARDGARVTVLERSRGAGGRAATANESGYLLNIGPHALYAGVEELLTGLGVSVSGGHPNVGRTIAFRGGRRYRLNLGGPGLLATGMLRLRDKVEAAKFLAALGRADAAALQSVTLAEWLDGHARTKAARDLAETLFRVSSYGNAPAIASAGAHIEQLRAAARKPVRYIDGGWQTIVESLRARAWDLGARIQLGARTTAVRRAEGGWQVVLASGERLAADSVILAVSPGDARRLLDGPEAHMIARWAEQAVPVQAAVLDVALTSAPAPKDTYALGIDRPLYYSMHSAVAKLAPQGGAVIHAAMYLDPTARYDQKAVQAELEALLDSVQPGWRDVLVHRRFMPSMNVTNAFVTAAQGGLPGRPGPSVPGAEDLFVAGDWVGPAGMLAEASLGSGIAAGTLAARAATSARPAAAVA